jgi:hypothetical protein
MAKKALHVSQKKSVVRFFLFLCLGLILAMTIMVFSSKTSADEDLTFAEKAREKKYLGGADEGELRVQNTDVANSKNPKNKTEDSGEGF